MRGYSLPSRCYFESGSLIHGDLKEVRISNFNDKNVILPKDYKLGYIEIPVLPQYTPVKPVDVVQCHFRKAAEPQQQLRSSTVTNEVATASIGMTPSRQVPKKTSSPCESAPKMSPKSARCPPSLLPSSVPSPPSLRTAVPSFSPVHSFLSPLGRSPFVFFYRRPLFSHPLLWQSPLEIPCDCQNVLSFPPKPGWQHRTKELPLCLC